MEQRDRPAVCKLKQLFFSLKKVFPNPEKLWPQWIVQHTEYAGCTTSTAGFGQLEGWYYIKYGLLRHLLFSCYLPILMN